VEIADTFDFLLGTWDLDRLVDDHRSGEPVSFEGEASVVAAGTLGHNVQGRRASYTETGEVRCGGHVGPAVRRLELVLVHDAAVMLHFTDGRPFLDLDLRTGHWLGSHLCGDDHYQIETFVLSHDVVQEHWRARGPTKDYDAVTTMRRTSPPRPVPRA
jgi:hypothetical protein